MRVERKEIKTSAIILSDKRKQQLSGRPIETRVERTLR